MQPRCCRRPSEALEQQRNRCSSTVSEINRLENEADIWCAARWRTCSTTKRTPFTLIKLKGVYELLEATTDRCEDVADGVLQERCREE